MTRPEADKDSRDRDSLSARLRHVYWIGGASGSGKSTIARRLADKHGLRLYSTDEATADHARRFVPAECPYLVEFIKMTMDQRWVDRSPQTMLETFHWFHGEAFGLIIEDLLALPPDQGVVAEGFRLLPQFAKPLLHDRSHGVWLIPTVAFRQAAFESRGTMWSIPNKTSNPKRALANLLERDRLFTERLRDMVETAGLPAVEVDGRLTEEVLESCIARKLGLAQTN
jgi:2-phosphoglycerate kinase